MYFIAMMAIMSGFFIVNQTKNFGVLNGLSDDHLLSFIASMGSVANTMRFLWSWWLDNSSFKVVYGTLIFTQIVLNFTMILVDKNWYTYALWVWLMMFCEGGNFTLLPNIMNRIFGSKAISVFGFFGSYISVVGFIQIALNDLLLEDTLRSYLTFFFLNGAFSCGALLLLLLGFQEKIYLPKSLRN